MSENMSDLEKAFNDEPEQKPEVLPPKKDEQKHAQPKRNELMTMEIKDGSMIVTTMDQKVAMIQAAISGGMLPKRYNNVGMVLSAMRYAAEVGLGESMVALRQIGIVDGNPCLYGDLPLSLCLKSGKLESMNEFFLDKDQIKICIENKNMNNPAEYAVCQVKRLGDSEVLTTYFSMQDAKNAGLSSRGTWLKYPRVMLKYRARSEALKGKFADFLNGIGIGEYDFDGRNEAESITRDRKETESIDETIFGKQED